MFRNGYLERVRDTIPSFFFDNDQTEESSKALQVLLDEYNSLKHRFDRRDAEKLDLQETFDQFSENNDSLV